MQMEAKVLCVTIQAHLQPLPTSSCHKTKLMMVSNELCHFHIALLYEPLRAENF